MKLGLVAICALVVSGCTSANFNSIHRDFNPASGQSQLIDAKQRALISNLRIDDNGNPIAVVCAEPSPDVAQAVASALSTSGALDAGGKGSAAAQLAGGTSEAVGSIGLRTQSIQLLRDSYYRNCEGYAAGALDDIAFNIVHQRFQNHTVALLAIEQLTGATVAPAVALAAATKGNSQANAPAISLTSTTSSEGAETTVETDETALNASSEAAQPEEPADPNATSEGPSASGAISTSTSAQVTPPTVSRETLPEHVSRAVASITHDALNQDYSIQLCMEFAREVFTKGSAAAIALERFGTDMNGKTLTNGQVLAKLPVSEMALAYCGQRLQADAQRQIAQNELVAAKAEIVKAVARGIAQKGSRHLSDKHALEIIEAIAVTLPNDTRTSFVASEPRITAGGITQRGNPCPEVEGKEYVFDAAAFKCVEKAS